MHFTLATLTQVPELALSEPECAQLAQCLANVERHFPHLASQRSIDIGALVTCAAGIYWSHYLAWRARVTNRVVDLAAAA